MQVYESNLDREEMKQSSSKKNANNDLADSKTQPTVNNKLNNFNNNDDYDYEENDDEEENDDSDDQAKNENEIKKQVDE